MANAEKAEIKIGMAVQVISRLDAKADGLDKNADALTAGWQILSSEFAQFQTIRKWLDDEFESEKISDSEFRAGMQVLAACVSINQKLIETHKAESVAHRFNAAGVKMASAIVAEEMHNEERKLRQALADIEEEEKFLREEAEFQSEDLPAEVQEDTITLEPVDLMDTPEDEEDPLVDDVEGSDYCSHCNEDIHTSTGGSLCAPCKSYENRYDKLPTDKVLEGRRQRKA